MLTCTPHWKHQDPLWPLKDEMAGQAWQDKHSMLALTCKQLFQYLEKFDMCTRAMRDC